MEYGQIMSKTRKWKLREEESEGGRERIRKIVGGRKKVQGSKEKRRNDGRIERKEKRRDGKETHFACRYYYIPTIYFYSFSMCIPIETFGSNKHHSNNTHIEKHRIVSTLWYYKPKSPIKELLLNTKHVSLFLFLFFESLFFDIKYFKLFIMIFWHPIFSHLCMQMFSNDYKSRLDR